MPQENNIKLHRKSFSLSEQPTDNKITIIPVGDEHYGSKHYDEESHNKTLEYILNTPNTYMIGMGDNMETATRTSVGAGIFEQESIVQDQLEDIYEKYLPLANENKILGLHIGNHEERVLNHSGMNLTKTLSKMLDTKYFGIGILHNFKINKQNYTMYTCHGKSASKLPHTKIKACIDLSNMVDVEIYAMGHVHQLSHHTRQLYQVNKRNKTVEQVTKHFILTGNYLNHWGSYAQEAAYEMLRKGSPIITLSANEHKIAIDVNYEF